MKETIKIEGMSCGGCVASVTNALKRAGVENLEVEIGSATVEYEEGRMTHQQIIDAIEDAGFDVVAG
ncbi:MAG: heavy-metal-associated domain-containing protein [Ignavibacteriae bacterium]|nr:heavy-metal-associated domain-containing protein [Ignavibacteriota bacterium]MCB9214255.1 heavy-metal-associated domain-containing protein [Ignavibacteria bacterium]